MASAIAAAMVGKATMRSPMLSIFLATICACGGGGGGSKTTDAAGSSSP